MAGTANTGGGGGGGTRVNASQGNNPGANGGAGIVIVRYLGGLAVQAKPVSGLGAANATLNGKVLSVGDAENPSVYFCWDYADAGTNAFPGTWDHVEYQGTNWGLGQSFSTNIGGLWSGSSYWVRCYASNTTGTAWSGPRTFTTVYTPSVTNLGATSIGIDSAELRGAITDTGGENPSVWFEYWTIGGSVTSTAAIGQQSGAFTNTVGGLLPTQEYQYRILASNAAGAVWSTVSNFTTRAGVYVASSGDNSDGTSWTKAFTDLQVAITACVGQVSVIYVKSGTYTNNSQLGITNAVNLTIRGGYNGDAIGGLPGSTSSVPSVLTRNTAVSMRILYATNSTLALDRLTVQGGLPTAEGGVYYGCGLRLMNCTATITNCVIVTNVIVSANDVYGGGIYASGGSLSILSSTLSTNGQFHPGTSRQGGSPYGGGIYAKNATVVMDGAIFIGNKVKGYDSAAGGALYLSGCGAELKNCRFQGNYCRGYSAGGVVYVYNATALSFSNCTFRENRQFNYDDSGPCGIAQLAGTGVNGMQIVDCVFTNNNMADEFSDITHRTPQVYLNTSSGSLAVRRCVFGGNPGDGLYKGTAVGLGMTNCLIYAQTNSGVRILSGAVSIGNCTIATNAGWGVTNAGGTVTMKNAVVWGNTLGSIAGAATITYSDIQGGYSGTGNKSLDPKFVNAAAWDFHEKSTAGSWHNDVGAFVADAEDSPCLDAGDPADSIGAEPTDNGNAVINMGRYGGTAQASKTSLAGSPPYMDNASGGATGIVDSAAWLNGTLTSTGTAPTYVWAFWDTVNRGTNKTWSGSYNFGGLAQPQGQNLSYQASPLSSNTWYWYTYYASNQFGDHWGQPTQKTFKTYGPPAVNNSAGATLVGMSVATLNGNLTNGVSANVYVYLWTNNAPTTNVFDFGAARSEGVFWTNVVNLVPGVQYWYRCYASNVYGTAWADSATNFTTKGPVFVYVTPTGAGAKNGADWDNAFDSVQSGVDACYGTIGTVYLKDGIHTNPASLNASNVVTVAGVLSLTMKGRYAGDTIGGLPGSKSAAPTILTRSPATSNRLFYASGCTVTVESVTFSNGMATTLLDSHYGGAGVYLKNCVSTLTNCVLTRNQANQQPILGLAAYVSGGSITLADCAIRTNQPTFLSGGTLGEGAGGMAVYGNATATLDRVSFFMNYAYGYDNTYGAAFYMSGGQLTMRNCGFSNNYMRTYYGRGLVELNSLSALAVSNCVFSRNTADGYVGNNMLTMRGTGAAGMRIEDCSIVSNTAGFSSSAGLMSCGILAAVSSGSLGIYRCVIASNNCTGIGKEGAGAMGVTNCLIYAQTTNGFRIQDTGPISIGNCTIATNAGWGITNAGSAAVTLKNSIVWDNKAGGLGGAATASYSDIQGGYTGTGNANGDPKFAGAVAGDFRLRPGSPCLNAGSNEEWMNAAFDLAGNKRKVGVVDMGCYESTAVPGSVFVIR